MIGDFLAYSQFFLGGVTVAAGDVTGDGIPDIMTGAGPGGGPNVVIFDGATVVGTSLASGKTPTVVLFPGQPNLQHGFYAFSPFFQGGTTIAVGDVEGTGQNQLWLYLFHYQSEADDFIVQEQTREPQRSER